MYPFFDVRSKNQADIRKSNLPSNLDLAFNQPLLAAGGIVHKSIIGAECSLEDRCKFPDSYASLVLHKMQSLSTNSCY